LRIEIETRPVPVENLDRPKEKEKSFRKERDLDSTHHQISKKNEKGSQKKEYS